MKPHIHSFRSQAHLVEHLEEEQKNYSPLIIDKNVLPGHPIRAISLTSKSKSIDVYFRRFDIGTEIYISDEWGSVFHTAYRGRKGHDVIKTLLLFLRSVVYRQANLYPNLADTFGILPIHFAELIKGASTQLVPQTRKVNADATAVRLELKATAYCNEKDEICYDFHCDGRDFHAQEFKDPIELIVSEYIIGRRKNAQHYPVYLSDLDLSLVSTKLSKLNRLQIVHYLRTRNHLEYRLNKAAGMLLNA